MKKVACISVLLVLSSSFAEDSQPADEQETVTIEPNSQPTDEKESTTLNDEFLELSEPYRNVSGAYYGLGLGLSMISHSLNCKKNDTSDVNFKKSASQFDFSLISGFGAPFYKRYYAGIELELFKRFSGNTSYNDSGEVGIIHIQNIGLNMDVRFGYLFPEQGSMLCLTVGVARVLGEAVFDKGDRRKSSDDPKRSFGSYYPTFGIGAEHKIDHNWNLRGDFRISIASKDDNKSVQTDRSNWKYEAKPGRMAFRVSITRNI